MYVRLAFAVAAHLEPEILVVDEVLAVGDAQFQKKCLGKIKDVATGGLTVLFVSHNMSMVQSLCSKAILLEKGSIARNGDSKKVLKHYITAGISREQIERINKKNKEIFLKKANITYESLSSSLVLNLTIEAKKNAKIGIECRLMDTIQAPLAFISRGRLDFQEKLNLQIGENYFSLFAKLPRLVKGKYFLWTSLSDPLICYFDICEELLEVEIENQPIAGSRMDYDPSGGAGHLDIPFQIKKIK